MHASGLQGEVPWSDLGEVSELTFSELVARLDEVAVVIPPHSAEKYSNLGFQLLGVVVERVSGRPFRQQLEEGLLRPLGLSSTTFDAIGELAPRRAQGYDARAFSDDEPAARALDSRYFEADGGLWSTVDDLARYIAFICGAGPDAVLAPASRAELLRARLRSTIVPAEYQGLAFYGVEREGRLWLGHAGSHDGFSSRILFDPGSGVGSIVLVNGLGDLTPLALGLAEAALAAVGEPTTPEVPWAPMPEAVGDLVGEYLLERSGEHVCVEWRAGRLVLGDDEGEHPLVATGDPSVYRVEGGRPAGERAIFRRAADGRIDLLNVAGYPFVRLAPRSQA